MKFEEFFSICSVMLEGENPLMMSLIKKRYDNCSEPFRNSAEMTALLETTATKMHTDHSRLFVHIKNLVTELKAQAAAGGGDAGQPSRKRKAKNPLQILAKFSRFEDSHSDSSDLEGMLQAHRTSFALSARGVESVSLPSKVSATGLQPKQSEHPNKFKLVKASETEGETVHPSAEKESVHTLLSSVEKDSSHTLPPKSGLQSVSLSVSGKELDHTTIAQAGKGSDHVSISRSGKQSNDTLIDTWLPIPGNSQCFPAEKEVGSAVNGLDSVPFVDGILEQSSKPLDSVPCMDGIPKQSSKLLDSVPCMHVIPEQSSKPLDSVPCMDVIPEQSSKPLSPQSCSITENTCLAQGSITNTLARSTPSSPDVIAADASGCSDDGKDKSKTNINGSLGELGLSAKKCDLSTVHAKPEEGCSDLHKMPDKPQAHGSKSILRVTPVQLTFPNKKKDIPMTEASPLGSILGSSSSKVISPTAAQPTTTSRKAVPSKTNNCLENQVPPLPSSTISSSPPMFELMCDDDGDVVLIDPDEEETRKPDVKCGNVHKAALNAVAADNHHLLSQPSTASSPKAGGSSLSGEAKEPLSLVAKDEVPDKLSKEGKHVRKYEQLLEKIRDKIEKVRDQDLSLDDLDAEDSSYIFEDRLQKKFIKVWGKLCRLKQCSTSSGRPVEKRFKFEGTRYPEINRKIQKFVNRPDTFPDFHDIKGIVKKVNTRCKIGFSALQINEISREAFLDVGEALQKRRHEDFISTFHSRQTMNFCTDRDPALFDDELRRKLDENQRIGKSRLEEVINKYSDMQMQLAEAGRDDTGGTDSERSVKSDSDGEDSKGSAKAEANATTKTPVRRVGNRLTSDDDDDDDDIDPISMIELDIAEETHLSEEYCPGRSHYEESSTTGVEVHAHRNIKDSNPDNSGDYHGSKNDSKISGPKDKTEQRIVFESSKRNLSASDELEHKSCFKVNQAVSGKQHSPNIKVNGDVVRQTGPNTHAVNRVELSPSRLHAFPRTDPLSKSRSPVMVNTSLRLPKFLFRNNGQYSGSKPETLFYPDRIQGAVSGEECEGDITIIGSSDEETGRVVVKTESIVKKEPLEFEWPTNDNVIVLSDSD